jgi:hypothetical protein
MLRSRTSRQSVALTILNFTLGVEQDRLPKDLILSRYAVETPNLSWRNGCLHRGNFFIYHWHGRYFSRFSRRNNAPANFRNAIPTACNGIWVLELMGFPIICAGAFFGLRAAAREAQKLGTRAAIIEAKLLLLPLFYTRMVSNHMALAFVGTVFAGVLPGSELTAGPAAHLPELVALRTKGG